ncbi:MAG: type I methionyl aminopeptidase [Patescibacteria group bacterium]
MIPIKTSREIKIMREAGKKLFLIMGCLLKKTASGVKLSEIEELALVLIKKAGGVPNFNKVSSYKWATCINVNNGVVHGVPDNYKIKRGDLISIDVGMLFKGYNADIARTVLVPKSDQRDPQMGKFLSGGEKALKEAVQAAKPGNRIGHISEAIEKSLKASGLKPIESFVGHGIGKDLHEEPQIPGFLRESAKTTNLIKSGMVFCIEVIYVKKNLQVRLAEDGWTVETEDGGIAGLFEDMIAITPEGPLVLTKA